MNRFWPEGLSVTDAQSPDEILEAAREEWENATEGVLTLVFQKSEPDDGVETITVHAKHLPSNRTATLLSVIHRLNEPYPVTIRPRKEDHLPDILKKSYYQPGQAEGMGFVATLREGKTVINKWVSDTPSEFRNKLVDAFNLSEVKAVVLNLTSSKGMSVDDDNAVQE